MTIFSTLHLIFESEKFHLYFWQMFLYVSIFLFKLPLRARGMRSNVGITALGFESMSYFGDFRYFWALINSSTYMSKLSYLYNPTCFKRCDRLTDGILKVCTCKNKILHSLEIHTAHLTAMIHWPKAVAL